MFPPILAVCKAAGAVTAIIGSNPIRLYPGQAPQKPTLPYVVWQSPYGEPDNTLADAPESDRWGVQVDVYAATFDAARLLATAIRNAIEASEGGYITAYRGEREDPVTKNANYRFDAEWITQR